jgi:hypothetical protein
MIKMPNIKSCVMENDRTFSAVNPVLKAVFKLCVVIYCPPYRPRPEVIRVITESSEAIYISTIVQSCSLKIE